MSIAWDGSDDFRLPTLTPRIRAIHLPRREGADVPGTSSIHLQVQNDGSRPRIQVPRASGAPRIDATAEDPVWRQASVLDGLGLSLGHDGDGLRPKGTEVRMLWAPEALYVRFVCRDDEVFAPHTGRDEAHHQGDVVVVCIDPIGDARQWYEIQVTPANQVLDKMFLVTAEPRHRTDLMLDFELMSKELWQFLEWDMPGLRSAARVDGTDWTVDMALPAEDLMRRHGEAELRPTTMRANFLRYDWIAGMSGGETRGDRRLLATNWAPVRYGQPHVSPAAMGHIELVD